MPILRFFRKNQSTTQTQQISQIQPTTSNNSTSDTSIQPNPSTSKQINEQLPLNSNEQQQLRKALVNLGTSFAELKQFKESTDQITSEDLRLSRLKNLERKLHENSTTSTKITQFEADQAPFDNNDQNDDDDDYCNFDDDNFDENNQMNLMLRSSNSFAIGFDDQTETHHSKHQILYRILTPADILNRQQEAIEKVSTILCEHLPTTAIRVLLQKYKWDADKMLTAYLEDPNAILKRSGLLLPEKSNEIQSNGLCQICFDDSSILTTLICGHSFCADCWKQYLSLQVLEKRHIIECMGNDPKEGKCHLVIDDFTIAKLLDNKDSEQRYFSVLVQSYVEENLQIKWCPAPGCENAVELLQSTGEGNEGVRCLCGFSFCFRCQQEEHQPCTCEMIISWKSDLIGSDDALLTAMFSKIDARPCPKCKVIIQKNMGCNHMNCTKCSYHFCWNCMEKFGTGPMGGNDGYSNHVCGKTYVGPTSIANEADFIRLERLQSFQQSFTNHQNSWKKEQELFNQLLNDCKDYLNSETIFLLNAFEQLRQNRHFLSQSFAFSYYQEQFAPHVTRSIFLELQLDLIRHTERLSGLLSTNDLKQLFIQKEEIINQTKLASMVHNNLFDASSSWALQDTRPHFETKQKRKRLLWFL